ncbi:MAG: carboxypeptidase regulatory-like domain-containing protein [Acidobacteriota bacterium]
MVKTITTLCGVLAAASLAFPAAAGDIHGTIQTKVARHRAGAVVYVDAVPSKTFKAPEEPAEIDQQDMVFVPHVLAVQVGTKVEFLNSDPFMHNVFSPDKCAERFNLGSWPAGQKRSYTFKSPCKATLLCNVHPEMEAFVIAVPTPYFAVTGKDGTYTIKNVPDGTYTVKVWHEKLKEASREITVKGETQADFQLKK